MFVVDLQHANEDVEKMILGNKCDMEDKRQVSKDRGDAVSKIEFGHCCRVHSFSVFVNLHLQTFPKNIDRKALTLLKYAHCKLYFSNVSANSIKRIIKNSCSMYMYQYINNTAKWKCWFILLLNKCVHVYCAEVWLMYFLYD